MRLLAIGGTVAAVALAVVAFDARTPREAGTPAAEGARAPSEIPAAGPARPVALVPPGQRVAFLVAESETYVVAHALRPMEVFSEPSSTEPDRVLRHPTENGSPLVFLVSGTAEADTWLEVQLPVRPNGSSGWIRATDVELRTHSYRIEVDVVELTFELFLRGEVVMRRPVAVGASETPTPGGVFYITELLQPPDPNTVYGPYAFGLSGFSNVLESFAGGEGVIGIHGTDDPDAIGNEVSAGCIRLSNDDIVELVGVLPLGTPVAIVA